MLDRFLKAQEKTYADALAELKAGRKRREDWPLDLVGVSADAWLGHVGVFGVLWHRG